jgi:hypothetical protein
MVDVVVCLVARGVSISQRATQRWDETETGRVAERLGGRWAGKKRGSSETRGSGFWTRQRRALFFKAIRD